MIKFALAFLFLPWALAAAPARQLGLRASLTPRSLVVGQVQTLELALARPLPPWRLRSVRIGPSPGISLLAEPGQSHLEGRDLQFDTAAPRLRFKALAARTGLVRVRVDCVLVDGLGQTRSAARHFSLRGKTSLDSGDARTAAVSGAMARGADDPGLSPEEREGLSRNVWKEPGPNDYRGNLPP